ncbi:MAG: hypothetical protein FJ104_13610, partial [Deltaproteobacteria bacterium]|nr:hypothetical protein [Deltaproteobacteria bacterium]
LEALAGMAGIELRSDIVANDRQFARKRYNDSDRTLLVTNRFSSHASVSTLSRNSTRAAVLLAGSGTLVRKTGGSQKVDIAVRAMSSSFIDTNRNYQPDPDEKRDAWGIAAAVSQPIEDSAAAPAASAAAPADKDIPVVAPPKELRAFVIADADLFTDVVLSNFMTNQLLLIDALRWLGGEESFAGEVNSEEDVRIEHTQQKDLVWFYATIIGAPALILGVGLVLGRQGRRSSGRKS